MKAKSLAAAGTGNSDGMKIRHVHKTLDGHVYIRELVIPPIPSANDMVSLGAFLLGLPPRMEN